MHMSDFMILIVKDRDLVRLLEHQHSRICKDEGHSFRPALIAWARIAHTRQRHFSMLLHNFRGRWLQDRVGIIADKPHRVADERGIRRRQGPAVGVKTLSDSRLVHHRAGA
jgi:hypothetical protein